MVEILDDPNADPGPPGRAFQRQSWRDLLFLHWPVPPEQLRRLVPPPLSIDLYQGTAYVGMVAFAIRWLRPAWIPWRLGLSFLETNVRTYVHVDGEARGVYFFSLDAASRLAVLGARRGFGLPYHHARMSLTRHGPSIEYSTRRLSGEGPGLSMEYCPGDPAAPSPAGTLEEFLLERYLLHVERGGRLFTGRVRHPPYPVAAAHLRTFQEQLTRAAGLSVRPGPPPLIHYSRGVDVDLFWLKPWQAGERSTSAELPGR